MIEMLADSANSGESFEDLLSLGVFKSLVHERGASNDLLSGAAKELNLVKSSIRACVEYVFRCMTMSMGREQSRKIELKRTQPWWGLQNLSFNFLSFLQRSSHKRVAA
jgi:hypothetical protein